MYLHRVLKSTLSLFDDKQCYENECVLIQNKLTKTSLASFVNYFFKQIRVSIPSTLPLDLVSFFKPQDIESSTQNIMLISRQ